MTESLLYSGKAKNMFQTDDPEIVHIHYKDQATALNGKVKEKIEGKGQLTSHISALLFNYLTVQGIENHFQKELENGDALVRKVKIVPLEVVTRNFAAGHFASRFNVPMHKALKPAVHEFYFKSDSLDDPFINNEQILALEIADKKTISQTKEEAELINQKLINLFDQIGITLIDFKVEFGFTSQGKLLLADELSPDNMRLLDKESGKSLDKDVFRQKIGDVRIGYQTVLDRLNNKLIAGEN
ncbi:phosphoribosylaminoimidazolesuccinocarboxamide synthase [Oenococcus oeni]|uniref:phosphoribosylaminoimidazolesuccinocarboxamide synthase n=1 Tax=Oenococcus oeni TaxID=1247 RepID=UPI000297CAD9|nr:phosphoribosylaminoimidazolesuccinocarboxamide synthase [Oenococcus oeni]EKP90267.1 phosphoribosylaminoimidazole-succinocarboxamide synthase [Oenococcus oeni DSM 20252 = AWRIB129]